MPRKEKPWHQLPIPGHGDADVAAVPGRVQLGEPALLTHTGVQTYARLPRELHMSPPSEPRHPVQTGVPGSHPGCRALPLGPLEFLPAWETRSSATLGPKDRVVASPSPPPVSTTAFPSNVCPDMGTDRWDQGT